MQGGPSYPGAHTHVVLALVIVVLPEPHKLHATSPAVPLYMLGPHAVILFSHDDGKYMTNTYECKRGKCLHIP